MTNKTFATKIGHTILESERGMPVITLELPTILNNTNSSKMRTIATQTPSSASSSSQSTNQSYFFDISDVIKILKGESYDYQRLAIMIKNNIGLLMSVLDSLYVIINGNVKLLSTILYAVISTIFSSGFALVNFFFSFIVYITALFYLLSMSGSKYKPFQWLNDMNISKYQANSNISTNTLNKSQILIHAIEDSIRSVFVASLKMSTFYGIYTYLVYSLFSVSIVYLPSIIASLLAFLPLIGLFTSFLLWIFANLN